MAGSPDGAKIFGEAIAEHLGVVREMEAQQPVLEAIARAIRSTWRRSWWGGFAVTGAGWRRWRLRRTHRR